MGSSRLPSKMRRDLRCSSFLPRAGTPGRSNQTRSLNGTLPYTSLRSGRRTLSTSWPGLSRPSTSLIRLTIQDVDARDERGHDESEIAKIRITCISALPVALRGRVENCRRMIARFGESPIRSRWHRRPPPRPGRHFRHRPAVHLDRGTPPPEEELGYEPVAAEFRALGISTTTVSNSVCMGVLTIG